jgi:outer membrane protein OmpA-like peptidoglycan-associated protein
MKKRRGRSTLHQQLGQEVIYLLLATFAVATFILALFLLLKIREQQPPTPPEPPSGPIGPSPRPGPILPPAPQPLQRPIDKPKDAPPILILKEGEGYSFPLGEATLTVDFQEKLASKAVQTILDHVRDHRTTIIEIIGHTDELPITGRISNLDTQLIPFLRSTPSGPPVTLSAADNVGLGMARAVAVARYLMNNERLKEANLKFLPMSAAQLITLEDELSRGDPREASNRRRIDIRARRSN